MASLCEQCDTPKIRSRRFAPYHEFFSDILSRQELGPEIYVPLHFINTTASKLMEQNGEAETLFMKNF